MNRLEILPIEHNHKKECVVRDASGLAGRVVPHVIWKYLSESEITDKALVGMLSKGEGKPLVSPLSPFTPAKKVESSPHNITLKEEVAKHSGELINYTILADGEVVYSGLDAPLVAEGIRIAVGLVTDNIQLSHYTEEVDFGNAATEVDELNILVVTIGKDTLVYDNGHLIFSGQKAIDSLNRYLANARSQGVKITMKNISYEPDEAPSKYLRDL